MEANKSLSARIQRRNKQGFKGVGNHVGMPSDHGYYNFNDSQFNHKVKNTNYQRLVDTAKKSGVKHPGSKALRQLQNV